MTDPDCLRFPLAHYPGMNRFVLDWLAGSSPATQFLPRKAEGDRPGGPAPDAASRAALVSALAASNRGWGFDVGGELERWAAGGTFTIIAGQQVGFAGGPLYTLVKLASLLKLKREHEARGVPVTLFFWMATEDHDFDEVARIALPRRAPGGSLDLVRLHETRTPSRNVIGPEPLPESLITELLSLLDMPRPSWLRPGISFRDSFAELLSTVIDEKIILVDALLPELRRAGEPLFDAMTRKWDAVQQRLATRADALRKAGYTPQVLPRDGEPYSLLFELNDAGGRELIESPRPLPPPERISTSALTRPLLQDFVLQPDVFVGGPAEVAYYAQVAPLHEILQVALPRVALRAHALVAPRRVSRTLERYGIQPEAVFASPDSILAPYESEGIRQIERIAGEARRELAAHLTRMGDIALPADHALARAVSRSIGHIEYHFEKLTERATRALVRKDRERYAAVRELVATLYPDRHVQDREVAWFAYFRDFGKDLVSRLVACIEPDAAVCSIVAL